MSDYSQSSSPGSMHYALPLLQLPEPQTEARSARGRPRSTSCIRCKTKKTRCIPPTLSPNTQAPCKACAAGGWECVYQTPGNARKSAPSLELISDRATLLEVVALFFKFVYPTAPCVHKPTFMAALDNRDDRRDPMFLSLVLSVVACALVHTPSTFLPANLDKSAARALAENCSYQSRRLSVHACTAPNIVVVRYLDFLYHSCEQQSEKQHAAFGEAVHLAITMRFHDEAAYERADLDFVEAELRRRVFWLLFGADKVMALLLNRPIALRDEDCTVLFPKEFDDECITPTAYLPREGPSLPIVGLNVASRMLVLLGEVILRIRLDKRSPPQDEFARLRLQEIESLHHRLCSMSSEVLKQRPPRPWRYTSESPPTIDLMKGFLEQVFSIHSLPTYDLVHARVLVLQQLVRCATEHYRDDIAWRASGTRDLALFSKNRVRASENLLDVLHSLSISALLVGGLNLTSQVRFIQAALTPAVGSAGELEGADLVAITRLSEFSSVLDLIEVEMGPAAA